jgi:hypothetical protein
LLILDIQVPAAFCIGYRLIWILIQIPSTLFIFLDLRFGFYCRLLFKIVQRFNIFHQLLERVHVLLGILLEPHLT